jgi:hypothetical protein
MTLSGLKETDLSIITELNPRRAASLAPWYQILSLKRNLVFLAAEETQRKDICVTLNQTYPATYLLRILESILHTNYLAEQELRFRESATFFSFSGTMNRSMSDERILQGLLTSMTPLKCISAIQDAKPTEAADDHSPST